MRKAIRLHDFGKLNESEKTKKLRELADSAHGRPNGELTLLEARIRRFEARYEVSSDEMQKRVASGRLTETADVASWLIALDVVRRLRADEARR